MDPDPSLLELTRTSPPAPTLRPSGLVRSALHSASQSGWVGPSLTIAMTGAISGAVVISLVEPNEPPASPAVVARTSSAQLPVPPTRRAATAPAIMEPAPVEALAEPLVGTRVRPQAPRATAFARGTASTLRIADSVDEPLGGSSSDEIRLLVEARTALGRGDLATAQASIDEHRRRFPRGMLWPERDAMRCDVLVQRGDCPGAIEIARRMYATDETLASRVERAVVARCGPDARSELPPPRRSSAHLDEYFARVPNDPCAGEADDQRANRCLVRTLRGDGMLELRTIALAYAALGRRADACRTMRRYREEYGTIGGRAFRHVRRPALPGRVAVLLGASTPCSALAGNASCWAARGRADWWPRSPFV
jgi:hypothetical protein